MVLIRDEGMSKEKPKILAIGVLPPPFNGMSVVFENLCQSAIAEEANLIILNIADSRDIASIGRLDAMNVLLALKYGWQFLCFIIKHKPDIVYTPIAQGTLGYLRDALFLVPCRLLNIPVVVHLHGSEFQIFYKRNSFLMKTLIKYTLAKVRRAIVLGDGLRGEFAGIVPPEKVVVIPNGITIPQAADQNVKRTAKGINVTYLGAMMRRKGYQEIINAIPAILENIDDIHFVFAGEICSQEHHSDVVNYIRRNNLEKYIEFSGVVKGKAKSDLLSKADIFCFPPIEPEGQPLVILEAMAYGLPVVSTRYGAIPDLIKNGKNGYVISPGDKEQLAEKITELASFPEKRQEMGRTSREMYKSHFTREKWANKLKEVFMQVVAEEKATGK